MTGIDLRVEVFRSKASILHHELHVNEGVVAKFSHYLSPIKNRHFGGLVDADVWNLSKKYFFDNSFAKSG